MWSKSKTLNSNQKKNRQAKIKEEFMISNGISKEEETMTETESYYMAEEAQEQDLPFTI